MKRIIFILVLVGIVCSTSFSADDKAAPAKKGGFLPFVYSFFLDPRAGYKVNEGDTTWVTPVVLHYVTGGIYTGVVACTDGGMGRGGVACCCGSLTPSGWSETDKYRIRGKEWARIIPIYNIVVHVQEAVEASKGVTWSEIVKEQKVEK